VERGRITRVADIVQATEHFSVQLGRIPAVVSPGDLYYADDPVVKGREHLFQTVEVRRSVTAKTSRATETATAAPGEKRRMANAVSTKDSSGEV
jgi:hypothetical protein